MIKFSTWDISQIDIISNIETAEQRWHQFLLSAPESIRQQIDYNKELSIRLTDARSSEVEDGYVELRTRDSYMLLAEMRSSTSLDCEIDDADNSYNWLDHRKLSNYYMEYHIHCYVIIMLI